MSSDIFLPSSITQLGGAYEDWTGLNEINTGLNNQPPNFPYGGDNSGGRTVTPLTPSELSDFIDFSSFNLTKRIGTQFTGLGLMVSRDDIPPDSIGEFIHDYEVYVTKNSSIISVNICDYMGFGADYAYGNHTYSIPIADFGDVFVIPFTENDLYTGDVGFRLNVKNDHISTSAKPLIRQAAIYLDYTSTYPKFFYNGDSTSEVFVTLDKNPAVTNPTTTFSVFHGVPDTTSPGTNVGYSWGWEYQGSASSFSAPNLNDPDGGFTADLWSSDYGHYEQNYLETPFRTSLLESPPFTLNSITNHIMSYNIEDLVAGQTYRRAMVLLNIRGATNQFKMYDSLFFNIEVIDSSVVEQDYPYFKYNGDTTSEISVTLNRNDTTSINFLIHHVTNIDNPVYAWNRYSTDGTSSIIDTSSWLKHTGNFLNSDSTSYCCDNEVTHTLNIDTTGMSPGTYRRSLALSAISGWDSPYDTSGAIMDNLWVNVTIPTIHPYFIYNGDSTSHVNITIDLYDVGDSTSVTFSLFKGDDSTGGYAFGPWYTSPNENDPAATYNSLETNPQSEAGLYDVNYLSTTLVTMTAGNGDYTTTDHIMNIDISNLVAGETYTRGLVMVNIITFSMDLDGMVLDNDYDILWFNISIIDSTPNNIRRRNTGTYCNFLI